MEIYFKLSTKLEVYEKYCLFLLNSDFCYLLLDQPTITIPSSLSKMYYKIYDIDKRIPFIVSKYDNNETVESNLLRMKQELEEEINIAKNNFEIIILQGNLENQLFDDNFFDKWSIISDDYLLISYYIKYHKGKAEEFNGTKQHKIANFYLTDNIIDNLKLIADYFVIGGLTVKHNKHFFEKKIKNLYGQDFF